MIVKLVIQLVIESLKYKQTDVSVNKDIMIMVIEKNVNLVTLYGNLFKNLLCI